jgi:hypothetical protein
VKSSRFPQEALQSAQKARKKASAKMPKRRLPLDAVD